MLSIGHAPRKQRWMENWMVWSEIQFRYLSEDWGNPRHTCLRNIPNTKQENKVWTRVSNLSLTEFLLICPRAGQLYRIESLHPLRHSVTAAVVCNKTKETSRTGAQGLFYSHFIIVITTCDRQHGVGWEKNQKTVYQMPHSQEDKYLHELERNATSRRSMSLLDQKLYTSG